MNDSCKVYVLTDSIGNIIAINSDAFLTDITNFIQIDEGIGDKYHHAQGNYFDKPITTEKGIYRYKLVDGVVVEKTDEEIQTEIDNLSAPPPSLEDQLKASQVYATDLDIANIELGQQITDMDLRLLELEAKV
ncbi:MAG: hypothetical protein N2Z65_03255 [Clostridiales bacterium]|nr:hypothetical protein [Clostridiales bacterium]